MKIDLYTVFKSNGLSLPFSPGFTEIQVFTAFIRIILACDAIHDFIGDRAFDNKSQDAQKDFFLKTTMYYLINEINIIRPDMQNECERLLNASGVFKGKPKILTYDNPNAQNSFIRNDSSAKEVAEAILSIMKLVKIPLADISRGECTDDPSFLRMLSLLMRVREYTTGQRVNNPSYNIKIDATSDIMNLIPIYSGILSNERKKMGDCPNVANIKLIEDLSTYYDPANTDQLKKFFKTQNLILKSTDSVLNYDIRIGDTQIIDCALQLFGSEGNETVKLSIKRYFSQTWDEPIFRTNDSVGQKKNNSVGSLALDMITSYNISSDAQKTYGGLVMKRFYELSIFKTMGDFLQLMTFLCLENKCENFRGISPELVDSITAFITFDKLCIYIGSIFSSFVVGETGSKTTNPLITGLSIFLNEEIAAAVSLVGYSKQSYNIESKKRIRREAADSLISMQSGFGKKTNKIGIMSNEQLKTKLKSVGINVTKISSRGKRLNLTRKEMEKKANLFKNLQLRAKKMGIKIMYKSRTRGYVYKTYTRLMNELEKLKQMKKSMKFG
tara:strand:+ start:80 stop:1747 length:1668 start_codon:yes stop_codon:yes gene_type:complete